MTRLPNLPDPALVVEGNPLFNTSQLMHYGKASHDLAAKPEDMLDALDTAVQTIELLMLGLGAQYRESVPAYEEAMRGFKQVIAKYRNI